jgi:hypothetical protein
MPSPVSVPTPAVADAVGEQKARRQAALIEALVNENDALRAKLTAQVPAEDKPAGKAETMAPVTPALVPDAEGIIDLGTSVSGEANPFAVRTATGREIKLTVSGVVGGKHPCALVNGRLLQQGEAVEAFVVDAIEDDAVTLRFQERRIRLGVSSRSVRVLLPN